ncbi:MAG: DUF4198 domain-containing protein [Pirellulales bacterium]
MNTRLVALAALAAVLAVGLWSQPAQAHFVWLKLSSGASPRAEVYFAEMPQVDDPDLLELVLTAKVWQVGTGGDRQELELQKTRDSLSVTPQAPLTESPVVELSQTYGVVQRGGAVFLLMYHAKAMATPPGGTAEPVGETRLPLELVPSVSGPLLTVTALWQGRPLPGAQVVVGGPDLQEDFIAATESDGTVKVRIREGGTYALRVRHIVPTSGTHEGQDYSEVRHYSTLTVPVEKPTDVASGH